MNTPKVGRSKQAKSNRQVVYQVAVIGKLWQGTDGAYNYKVDEASLNGELDVKALAVDFSCVYDYRIIKVASGGTWEYSWTRCTVVRDWGKEGSADSYLDAEAGA